MVDVDSCPFSRDNEHYPYEGWVTQHKRNLKPKLSLVCDEETSGRCELLRLIDEHDDLRKQMGNWRGGREDCLCQHNGLPVDRIVRELNQEGFRSLKEGLKELWGNKH